MKIDTGSLVKELKAAEHTAWAEQVAVAVAERFGLTAFLARRGLAVAAGLGALRIGAIAPGPWILDTASSLLHGLLPQLVPHLPPELPLPGAAGPLPRVSTNGARPVGGEPRRVVYFPSCLSRILGPLPGETGPTTPAAVVDVLGWAGYQATYPDRIGSLCCGMPFGSKAYFTAAERAATKTMDALWEASREGRDPIVTDASPCAGTLIEAVAGRAGAGRAMKLFDFASFWAREVLPGRSSVPKKRGTATLHPTCSLIKQGGLPDLMVVARAHGEAVTVPVRAECCGFAGDRGFLVPELTASATRAEAAEVRGLVGTGNGGPPPGLYSTCRTCELGLGRAVGRPYRSVAHLVHEAIRNL